MGVLPYFSNRTSMLTNAEKLQQHAEIENMLPRTLFENSKDWVAGDVVSRVEWLLLTIDTLKEQIRFLETTEENAGQHRGTLT